MYSLTADHRLRVTEVDDGAATATGPAAIELLASIADSRRAIAACVLELKRESMGHDNPAYVRMLVGRIKHLEYTLTNADDGVSEGRLKACRNVLRDAVGRLPKRPAPAPHQTP